MAQLQWIIPTKILYYTGANNSCLSDTEEDMEAQQPRPVDSQPNPCHCVSGQTLNVVGILPINTQIWEKNIIHHFYVIWKLHKDVIMGVDVIHAY